MPTDPHGPYVGGTLTRIVVQHYETTPEALPHQLIEAFTKRWPEFLAWLTITPGGLVSRHFAGEPWLHRRGWPPRDFQAAFARLQPQIEQIREHMPAEALPKSRPYFFTLVRLLG